MGLAVSTGFLQEMLELDVEGAQWFRTSLKPVNELLVSNGFDPHDEPESVPAMPVSGIGSFPYSYLHYLRRAYARVLNDAPVTPLEEGANAAADSYIEDEVCMLSSHLLCHSDAEGLYVPIDMPDPLFDTDEPGVAGGMLGSSQGLLRELAVVAPAIGIDLDDEGRVTDETASSINDDPEDHPLHIERLVWLTLHLAGRHSVEHGTAIVFH